MTDKTKLADLHSGRFGEFFVSGFFIQGNGLCGRTRRGWVVALRESAASNHSDQEHRYLVYETDFQEVLEGDLSKGVFGAPSLVFDEKIADVPPAMKKAALEAIAIWESQVRPAEGRCLSRCNPAKRMGTDYCAVIRKRKV
jgi:hypothetical protein